MYGAALLPAQAAGPLVLTNLGRAPAGVGLPDGWVLRQPRGTLPPLFAVTDEGALRVEAADAAGFALFTLEAAITAPAGAVRWRWRTGTPIEDADLRDRVRDDSPVRVLVAFADRRTLFYSWGNREAPDAAFRSWTSRSRGVIVTATQADAHGAWIDVCRDPRSDYRRVFRAEAPAIVAVGVSADTEQLHVATWAEVADLIWQPAASPPPDLCSLNESEPA